MCDSIRRTWVSAIPHFKASPLIYGRPTSQWGYSDYEVGGAETEPAPAVVMLIPRTDRRILAGGLGLGAGTLALADFLDHAAANIGAAEAANGLQFVFGANDGEPGDAVIEHGSGGDEDGVVESDIEGIGREKVAEFAAGQVAARLGGNDGDASDHIVEVIAVQCAPEALLFVENQELAGWTFVQSDDCVCKSCLCIQVFCGKRVQQGRQGLIGQERLGKRQTAPEIAGAASEGP